MVFLDIEFQVYNTGFGGCDAELWLRLKVSTYLVTV